MSEQGNSKLSETMDISSNETFKTLNEQFVRIKNILKSDKIGTETEPAWNESESKSLLDSTMCDLNNLINTTDDTHPNYYRLIGMKCAIIHEEAKILLHLGEYEQAQNVLGSALESLKDLVLKPELTFLTLRLSNHYAFVLSKQEDLTKPQAILERAEQIYMDFKNQNTSPSVFTAEDLFFPGATVLAKKETVEKLERLVTNNYQMLSYVYNKEGKYENYALMQHTVLRRQLEFKGADPLGWAMRAARLAAYFISKSRFRDARHHLAAASHIVQSYESELKASESADKSDGRWEELLRRCADVAKYWVKYGLFLFNMSKTELVAQFYGEPNEFLTNMWLPPSFDTFPATEQPVGESTSFIWGQEEKPISSTADYSKGDTIPPLSEKQAKEEKDRQSPNPPTDYHTLFSNRLGSKGHEPDKVQQGRPRDPAAAEEKKEEVDDPRLRFPSLNLSQIEEQVTAALVETTEQARALFLYTHSWLKRAKNFYTLRDHPIEYVNAILDLSELYRYLAFYEEDIESQYSVQKRRADALETLSAVLREVRPQYYHAVNVELLRELAEVQLELLSLNLRRIYVSADESQEHIDPNAQNSGTQSASQQSLHQQEAGHIMHKMDALSDIHSKLEYFSESISRQAVGENINYSEVGRDFLSYFP